MTVKELKKLLINVPNNYIVRCDDDEFRFVCDANKYKTIEYSISPNIIKLYKFIYVKKLTKKEERVEIRRKKEQEKRHKIEQEELKKQFSFLNKCSII